MSAQDNQPDHEWHLEELTEDYVLEPVPDHVNTTGWKVAMVICAIGITLPAIWVSSDMAINEGFWKANTAFWLGNVFVAFAGIFTAIIGSRSRLSSYMILQFSFGPKGASLVNLLMAITLLGWFASTAELFGVALNNGIAELTGTTIGTSTAIIMASLLMTATTIWGYSMVERFSILSVPLLAAFMFYVAYLGVSTVDPAIYANTPEDGSSQITLVSITIGLAALTAVLMPDFTRYCPNDRQSIIAAVVGIGITYPAVMTMASVPAVATGEADFVTMMVGMGVVFAALVVLIFATWSTNITNLYSATLTLATFMPKTPNWKITIGGAIIATILAVTGVVEQYFIGFLLFLGFGSMPIIGVYVVDFFFVKESDYSMDRLATVAPIGFPALIAWGLGFAVGYMNEFQIFGVTPLPTVDAMVTAAVSYYALVKLIPSQDRSAA